MILFKSITDKLPDRLSALFCYEHDYRVAFLLLLCMPIWFPCLVVALLFFKAADILDKIIRHSPGSINSVAAPRRGATGGR